jgi:hypothetical protein
MRAAVALVLSLTLFSGACFPNNPKHQTYAKLGEGASMALGIGLLLAVNTGADCDMKSLAGVQSDESCKTRATVLGDAGLALILIGLVGFIATVSTAEDAKPTPTVVVPKAEAPTPTPTPTPIPTPTPAPTPPPEPAPAPVETAPAPTP